MPPTYETMQKPEHRRYGSPRPSYRGDRRPPAHHSRRAGSLFVAPGVTLRASGHVPKEWLPIVDAPIQVLRHLKQSSIDWTYFSPAGFFEPGERTGKFRLGKDDLITDAQGNSRISFEDYAIALVDELENPQHHRSRIVIQRYIPVTLV
jgi:putative NADH-flavin reductase